jgi:hypothetical protein
VAPAGWRGSRQAGTPRQGPRTGARLNSFAYYRGARDPDVGNNRGRLYRHYWRSRGCGYTPVPPPAAPGRSICSLSTNNLRRLATTGRTSLNDKHTEALREGRRGPESRDLAIPVLIVSFVPMSTMMVSPARNSFERSRSERGLRPCAAMPGAGGGHPSRLASWSPGQCPALTTRS